MPKDQPAPDADAERIDAQRIADEAAALADQHIEDDQDKAGEATGGPIDVTGRRVAIGVDIGGSGPSGW